MANKKQNPEVMEEDEPPKHENVSRETTENTTEKEKTEHPKKHQYFTLLLYPENPRHLQLIVDIRSGKYPDATAILHNRDIPDEVKEPKRTELQKKLAKVVKPCDMNITEFEFKKPHVHVVYKAPYQARKTWAETRFPNIESNLIKGVNEPHAIYRYLVHQDNPEKTQYNPNEVFGCTERFYHYYNSNDALDEYIAIPMILDILDNWDYSQGKPTYSKIIRICCEQGLYGHLRCGGALLNSAIRECIQEYISFYEDEKWLEAQYREVKLFEENERLTIAIRRSQDEIKKWRRLAGYEH